MRDEAVRAELVGSVFLLAQRLTRRVEAALGEVGLTAPQWLLLAVLDRMFPGRAPSLTEAAAAYGTSRQNVRQIAEQLDRRGFLTIERDGSDRRVLRLVRRPIAEVLPDVAWDDMGRAVLADLTGPLRPADRRALRDLVTLWVGLLDDRHEEDQP